MISLSHLNKLIIFVFFLLIFFSKFSLAEEEPVDIWKSQEDQKNDIGIQSGEQEIKIENSVLLDDEQKTDVTIDEDYIGKSNSNIIGIFDPEDNNFDLNMWSLTDGEDIKKILKRIDKLKLSKLSEDLLFRILFTNAYSPKKNLTDEEFFKIKVDWLIKHNRIEDIETLLKNNPEAGKSSKAIKFLINEYLSSTEIKSACDKINFIDRNIQNNYLDKFTIYCLINNDLKEDAQLVFDLLKERGFEDNFFEDKINFLLGISEETKQVVLDNNLLNFYLSHITSNNFEYKPDDKTDKYIWRYLSSVNLIQIHNFEDEEILLTYEQAASDNSFENSEIFEIYLKMNFNFNQLSNAEEIYKNLSNSKARSLIYQSVMLSHSSERKIKLAFLLKDLFAKDKLLSVYKEELSNILRSINPEEVPKDYAKLIEQNLEVNSVAKVKFDNDILHKSKVIKHFLENENENEKNRTEKDFKSVYKKIKKNKKYFISIKDIIVLESLEADGILLPEDLDIVKLASQLTVPKNLEDLANQNQLGLVMLKIVEIIGEDSIINLDPETIYFINKILNQLNLKKIRNSILSEALPIKV